MEKLFMDFEFTTEFFIMVGLFLIITFMITIIIVYFLTKVKTLISFLGQAKEIDDVKNKRISVLETQLQEEKVHNITVMTQLKNFDQNRETLSEREKEISELKESINLQSQKHMESTSKQRTRFEELKSSYDRLHEDYDDLMEKYRLLTKRNEALVKENTTFHTRLREVQVELNVHQKKNTDKVQVDLVK